MTENMNKYKKTINICNIFIKEKIKRIKVLNVILLFPCTQKLKCSNCHKCLYQLKNVHNNKKGFKMFQN